MEFTTSFIRLTLQWADFSRSSKIGEKTSLPNSLFMQNTVFEVHFIGLLLTWQELINLEELCLTRERHCKDRKALKDPSRSPLLDLTPEVAL